MKWRILLISAILCSVTLASVKHRDLAFKDLPPGTEIVIRDEIRIPPHGAGGNYLDTVYFQNGSVTHWARVDRAKPYCLLMFQPKSEKTLTIKAQTAFTVTSPKNKDDSHLLFKEETGGVICHSQNPATDKDLASNFGEHLSLKIPAR